MLLVVALLAACGGGDGAEETAPSVQAGPIPEGATMPEGHPPVSTMPQGHPDVSTGARADAGTGALPADARTGTVKETLRSAGYTYALMDFDGEELWVAGPNAPIEEGDEVTVSGLMGMTDFHARSLNRTFDAILFASTFSRDGRPLQPGG